MTVAIIGSIVLAIVVFAFVLEPVLRAQRDRVVLDDVALPQPIPLTDDEVEVEDNVGDELVEEEHAARARIPVDRPLSSDLT